MNIQFLWHDDPDPCPFYRGCRVQFGDAQPKLTSQLTGPERDAVLAKIRVDRTFPADRLTQRVVTATETWTDRELVDRLDIDPGDVPLWRAGAFVSVSDTFIVADHAGWDLGTREFWDAVKQ